MNRRSVTLLIVGVVVLLIVAALVYNFTFSPRADFARHFGRPIPKSVDQVDVSGYTALAGSDETLVFRISPSDLEAIVRRRNFPELTDGIKVTIAADVLTDKWKHHIDQADKLGIQVGRFFEITELDGLVYYILIADADSDWVYYHYSRM